ncbi:WD repeat-containing protein 1 [Dermatophagoides pteronyssinus]|uniref:WD repeat-containing protein 1 n=1 Tax=Dermatophagoides pteronyssinus TaxID=6956 RepID=A0ABQ8J4Y2_DERPT|nr:WD repeat-containing protein 1 [Dermatophagoides pteronyssinus]
MFQNRNTFATLPRTQRGMPLVLGGDPKGKNFLYPNGNSIIIRNIDNPSIADIYTEHSTTTTVAKYSPSGFYICSADIGGRIRIWDTTQSEHILKNEFQPFAGNIKDLAWSPDSQRIVVVGEGRERFGHVIMMETGTSVGEIAGHSKTINSCDFRPARPFRIVTGSEDNFVGIYEGPPFKFKTQLSDHSRFVQSVRYSPDGQLFATAGFDGKMFLYNANDYSKLGEFTEKKPAHAGGIYAISWSNDGKQILSSSGDKTCKIWDISTFTAVTEFPMGSDVLDQQVSCLWQNNHLLSVSLSGFINYLDINNPSKPLRIVKGHNRTITALTINQSTDEQQRLYTGSCDGYITHWNPKNGEHDRIVGKTHSNQVSGLIFDGNNRIYSAGFDDIIRTIDANTNEFISEFKLDQQPQGLTLSNDKQILIIACHSQLQIRRSNDGGILSTLPAPYEPSSITCNQQNNDIAVGGNRDSKVHVYQFDGQKLIERSTTLDHRAGITDVSYSPNGKYLAASDQNRKIILYNTDNYQPAHDLEWGYHTARVNCLAWSPDSLLLASGSLDTGIIIWDCSNPTKHFTLKKAHPQSQVTQIVWLNQSTIISTGHDGTIKTWEIKLP